MKKILALCQTIILGSLILGCQEEKSSKILTEEELHLPEYALTGLEIAEGLQVQIFAHEPMVRNPTNMDIDDKGRVWITEGRNYRPWKNEDNPYDKKGDQIIILEDTDGDGVADDRKVFYQGADVDAAIGICVLDNKVIVSSSPDILVITDTDGDDKADTKEKLFTGISGPQNEHSVHAFVFGPDGKLYFNFGNAGKQIADKNGDPVIDIFGNEVNDSGKPYRQGMAFRCNPDGSAFEVLAHNFRNNYELAVDSYGTLWQSDNDDDGNKATRINYLMEYGNFGFKDELTGEHWNVARQGMHKEIPQRHWHQNDPGVVPNLLITGSGSPAGITIYEGELLPEIYRNQIIHVDAGPGLTRVYPKIKKGAGYTAIMSNILSRTVDTWHRPSDVAVAPDGSLFVADWYDPGVGGNLAGDPLGGRIFRIAPDVGKYRVNQPNYSSPESAVEALKSPNMATRYKAWTNLNNWGDQAKEALLKLWNSNNSIYRARALWLLTQIEGKAEQYLDSGLNDPDPDIRVVSIRAARQIDSDNLETHLKKVLNDKAPEVRREIAIALRNIDDQELAARLWTDLAMQHDGRDRWYLEALGIGAMGNWVKCFDLWLAAIGDDWNKKPGRDIVWRSRAPKSLEYQLALIQDSTQTLEEVSRHLRATDFQQNTQKSRLLADLLEGNRSDQKEFNTRVISMLDPEFISKSAKTGKVVQELLPDLYGSSLYMDLVSKLELKVEGENIFRLVLENPNHEIGVRAASLTFKWSGVDPFSSIIESTDEEAKMAVIQNLGYVYNREGKELLQNVVRDENQSISIRRLAAESLSRDGGWEDRVIRILKDSTLDEELRTVAATKLLGANRPMDRALGMDFLSRNQLSDELPTINVLAANSGDVQKGTLVFEQFCSSCHQIGGQGIAFGPDLSEIGNKVGKEGILMSILNPDAGISFGFEGEVIETSDGRTFSGYVLNETSDKVELRLIGGIHQSISKTDIKSRNFSVNSLMTPNLHTAMGQDKLTDLVEFLLSLKNYQTMAENPFQGQINYERGEP